ncbi:MAG: NAD(P)H-hydrate epimerase [Balneolaceae bacterium]|nr:NAD(P)H-hydrate epimerase [Balneolaceae bacterium]
MLNIPYSYYLCSAGQCRHMDEKTISDFGIDGFTLMETAGTRAADYIEAVTEQKSHGLFICGKGNNAGDALVVARLLSQHEVDITICFISGTDSLTQDTSKNLDLLKKLDTEINIHNWDTFAPGEYDFIVDGMLGTGLDSEVREPYSDAIKWINQQECPVFSLDVPTGLHADSGRILGTAVKADYTLSFGALKTGFYLDQGFDITGQVVHCELSFPNKYKKATAYLIDQEWVNANSPDVQTPKHKYDSGVLYIIAGSEGLTGAAVMAARSAWSAGLGAVVLITPKGLLEIYEKNLVQIIKKPVGNTSDSFFEPSHLDEILNTIKEKPGAVLIGPGLGRKKVTIQFAQQFIQTYNGKLIIDADALYALGKQDKWDKPQAAEWILTPHPGELQLLLNPDFGDSYERMMETCSTSKEKKVTILSKGLPSIVATTSGQSFITGYDTRIFARAGFGDILAGKIGAYWLTYPSTKLACFHALLNGYEKAAHFIRENERGPEPLDII